NAMNPFNITTGGTIWLNNNTGTRSRGVQLYGADNRYFGKAVGLGDIEVLCDPAPTEIGNRVWLDTNKDGIQGAGEAGINNVTVTLACGTDTATATTNTAGEYYFSNKTGGNATFMDAGESCTLKVNGSQTSLSSYTLTTQNADSKTDNNRYTDIRDSDAANNAGTAEIAFTVGSSGQNNHGLDFGYQPVAAASGLSGKVWLDSNKDGLQNDGTTSGIEGATVELYNPATSSVLATKTTGADGSYQFTSADGLQASTNYQIRIATLDANPPLSYWAITSLHSGSDPLLDSDAAVSGSYWTIALSSPTAGNQVAGNNFGFVVTPVSGCLDAGSTGVSNGQRLYKTHGFDFGGQSVVGYCAEMNDADPAAGDNYSVNSQDRLGLTALQREKIARSYAALTDPDIVFTAASAFPVNQGFGQNFGLSSLLHYMGWYYIEYNEDLNAMSAARLDTNSNYTPEQRIVMKALAGKIADRVNGANGETQYPVQDMYWLWNLTSTSRQDIIIPALYAAGSSCTAARTISGKVFEDVNYGGGAGRAFGTAGTAGVNGARVEVYNATGNFLSSTTTAADGTYTLNGLSSGNYYVRVVNDTVRSTRTGSNGTERGIQIYRTDGITAVNNEVGGRKPAVVDSAANTTNQTLNTTTFKLSGGGQAQSVQPITIADSAITGANFGFNFSTVINTNDSGQGSLRQFMLNAALLGSDNTLAQTGRTAAKENAILELSTNDTNYNATNQYWSIAVQSELPLIGDDIILDASTQPARATAPSFTFANRPVIELNGSATAGTWANGLRLNGSTNGSTVKYFAINRFDNAGIKLTDSKNNLIEANYIGTDPTATANNLSNKGHGVNVISPIGLSVIRGNLIAYNNGDGVTAWNFNGVGADEAVLISSNSIYANLGLGINLVGDGITLNDANDVDTGPNKLLNFPILSELNLTSGNLTVKGCAPAGATVELFEADVSVGGKATPGANKFGKAKDYGEGQTYLSSFVEGSAADTDSANCALPNDTDGNNQTGMKAFSVTIPVPSGVVGGDTITSTATLTNTGTSEFSPVTQVIIAANISGTVYTDGDGNNTYDSGTESGIGSITVTLLNAANNATVATTSTAASGSYSFSIVNTALTYKIQVDTADTDLPIGAVIGTTNPLTSVTVTAGGTKTNQNFGFDLACSTVVTTTADTDNAANNSGSLRDAIQCANATPGADTITFNMPNTEAGFVNPTGTGNDYWSLALNSQLPSITEAVTIDGRTQTTNKGNTNAGNVAAASNVGPNALALAAIAAPEVEIVGQWYGAGFDIKASNVNLYGLGLRRFDTDIRMDQANTTGILMSGMAFGVNAVSGTDPGAGQRSNQHIAVNASDVSFVLTNSVLGYNDTKRGIVTGEYNNVSN
ncbi:MAG: SdrD B-like domain-containing protein, partial [Thiothrix litoralis]